MGLLTALGFVAATTAVSKVASKAAAEERKAEELRLQAEEARKQAQQQEITKRTLALEAEKTRRQIAMQEAAKQKMILQQETARQKMALQQEAIRQREIANQKAIERHRQEIATIRQMRIEHPIDYTCPCCTALRIVDRKTGKVSCEYCGYVQPLESFHNFVPELDATPATRTAPSNKNVNNGKTTFNIWSVLSIVFASIAFFTCGALIVPEILGVVLGIIPLCQSREKRSGFDIGLSIAGIVVSGISLLIIILILIAPSSSTSSSSAAVEATTASSTSVSSTVVETTTLVLQTTVG